MNANAKHTPGPWTVTGSYAVPNVTGPDGLDVAWPSRRKCAPAQANARLIAAAPEMLAALLELVPVMDKAESDASGTMSWEWVSRRINAARAAISKAEGR